MPKQKISLTKKDILEEKKDSDIWWQDSKRAGKKTLTTISILILIIIAIGLVSVLFDQKNKLNQKETDQLRAEIELSDKNNQNELDALQSQLTTLQKQLADAQAKQAQTIEKSTIEGSLSFPSNYIPEDMQVCALDTTNDQGIFCTKDHITDKKYTYGVGYKIEVPAGSYNVYATVSSWQGYKAYYSDFVTCGLKSSCPSHNPIEVKVDAGQSVTKIDPIDWYKQ